MAELSIEDLDALNPKPKPCKSCKTYKAHGKDCWYYWEEKRDCSQHMP
ncbi:MAG: hypothetical protein ACE5DM_03340 [Candidatus Nanoarchaeia archaeon]